MQRELPHPVYAAMVEHCDDLVGRIVDSLKDEELTENTLMVFTSDNGGLYRRYDYRAHADDDVTSLAPLKGEKGTLYEGGIRVPLIVKYPGVAKPGTICEEPTISYDFYPTFLDIASGAPPQNQTLDGLSLKPLLTNPDAKLERDALHWHYPHYHHDRPASGIRSRDWKLIEYLDGSNDLELYHLSQDLGETVNLAEKEQDRAEVLERELQRWRQQVIARMPIHNPSFDPEKAHEWWSMRTGTPVNSDGRTRYPQTEKDL